MSYVRLKRLLCDNDGGVWGDDPTGEADTPVLRSTEQNADGSWRLHEPALRRLSEKERLRYKLLVGDIVVTKSSGSEDHIGKSSIVTPEIAALEPVYSNFMQKLRVRQGVCPRFIWYVLNSTATRFHYVVEATSTSGLGNLTGGILGRVPVYRVDLSTQKRIADFLDRETTRIDALIAKKERLGDAIDQRRAAVITAAVAGKIGPAAGTALACGCASQDIRLRFMLQLSPSAREIQKLSADDDVTFAPMDALDDGLGGLNPSNPRTLGEVAAGSYNYFREGDILLAKVTPCFENGKKALAQGLINGVGFATSEVHVLRPTPEKLDARFLMYLLSSEDFRAEGMKSMTGAGGLKRVSEAAILNYRPRILDVDLQRKVADFLDREMATFEVIKGRTRESIDRLREYRAALITAAVTGQIDVDAARAKGTVSAGLDRLQQAAEA